MTALTAGPAWAAHLAALRAANEDRADGRAEGDPCATPLLALARALPQDAPLARHAADVGFRFESCAFLTRRASHEVWAAMTGIESLLSDGRRFAPRFVFAQLRGEARLATGNEYRLALTDSAYLPRLNAAMAGGGADARQGDATPALAVRRMDLRILHAGAFGGETADMTWTTLASHRLAGLSSFWAVVHGDDNDGLRVSIETAELFRWAWGPEREIDMQAGDPLAEEARVVNWPWFFERLAGALDGIPVVGATRSQARSGPWPVVGGDAGLRESLAAHPALRALADRFDAEARRR